MRFVRLPPPFSFLSILHAKVNVEKLGEPGDETIIRGKTYPVAHVQNMKFIDSLFLLSSSKENNPGAVHLGEAEGSTGRRANTTGHWRDPLT